MKLPKELSSAYKIRDYYRKHVREIGTVDRIISRHMAKCEGCKIGICRAPTMYKQKSEEILEGYEEECRQLELKYGIITP